ncbi:hypothetical protein ACHWQZ_G010367 [Mnemiopsis leidyi]
MISEGDWNYDETVVKNLGQKYLKNYAEFIEAFDSKIGQNVTHDLNNLWDFTLKPLYLQVAPYESIDLMDLVKTDNKSLNKVILVLSSLCLEVSQLKQQLFKNFIPSLLMYGERSDCDSLAKGEAQLMIGRMLPLLQEIRCFITRSQEVARNIISQLDILYGQEKVAQSIVTKDVHFLTVFEALGMLFTLQVVLDEIIENSHLLNEHWTLYRSILRSIHKSDQFNFDEKKLRTFEKLLSALEVELFDGHIFQNCIKQKLPQLSNGFQNELSYATTSLLSTYDSAVASSKDKEIQLGLLSPITLFIFHSQVFHVQDRKTFRQIWDLHKKIAFIQIAGPVMLPITSFLKRSLPFSGKFVDKKMDTAVVTSRQAFLQNTTQNLSKDVDTYKNQVAAWCSEVVDSSVVSSTGSVQAGLEKVCGLLINGLVIAKNISSLVTMIMNMHYTLAKPITKNSVLCCIELIQLLKTIECMFHEKEEVFAMTSSHLIQQFSLKVLNCIDTLKKKLTQDKRYSDSSLDIIASFNLIAHCINGCCNGPRKTICRLAIEVARQGKALSSDDNMMFVNIFRRIEVITEYQCKVRSACDTSFIYWHRSIAPVYFSHVFNNPTLAPNLQYFFAGLADCHHQISMMKHLSTETNKIELLEKDVKDHFEKEILQPLCNEIETDLRLSTHSHLQLDDRNPLKYGKKNISALLATPPIRFFDSYLDIKKHVTHYLDSTFYNLTTVALHDWRSYAVMRNLAHQKYGLQMIEAHLPSQTIEQGIDVLEIMRNIHVFVSRYSYNLNNQLFVEQSSNNKHLNTINIRHIANSIRTHGTGIMNTTINFTFQYLRKKFFVFSQFLYDDHIYSRLVKDARYFKEQKDELDQCYPYERADKFNRGIRKLGLTPEGLSFLDQFRILITHIGNAMGYIRMIRSGGIHACANAIRFVPDLDDIVNLEELTKEEELPADTVQAAANLDSVLNNLTKNFAEGTAYFKMLVDVFTKSMRDPKNQHLKNFYMIIPPLTLNFVEQMMNGKEKINKKNKIGATFTDDGFSMGIAYILKLLDQYSAFDSLHWFQSVNAKFRSEEKAVKESKQREADVKLDQTNSLTMKRLDQYRQEFELLYYSLSSARIFFRTDLDDIPVEVNKAPVEDSSPAETPASTT